MAEALQVSSTIYSLKLSNITWTDCDIQHSTCTNLSTNTGLCCAVCCCCTRLQPLRAWITVVAWVPTIQHPKERPQLGIIWPQQLPGRMSTSAAQVAMADTPASLQQQQQDNSSQPAIPKSVLGLIADLHMFELQLGMLRQQAHLLAADRARIQGQLQHLRSAQHSIAQVPAAASGAAAASVSCSPAAAASGAQQLVSGLIRSNEGAHAGLHQQSTGKPAAARAQQQQQQQLTVPAAAGSGGSSRSDLKRTAQQRQEAAPSATQAKRQQQPTAAAAAPAGTENAINVPVAAAAGAAAATAATAAARTGRMKSMVVMGEAAKRPLPEEPSGAVSLRPLAVESAQPPAAADPATKKPRLSEVAAAGVAGEATEAAADAAGAAAPAAAHMVQLPSIAAAGAGQAAAAAADDPAAKRPRRSEVAAAGVAGEGRNAGAGAAQATSVAAAREQQQAAQATDATNGARHSASPQRQQQPQNQQRRAQQQQQQQQQPHHLPSAPLPLAQHYDAYSALDAAAAALDASAAALAAARQAAGRPFPFVPPLGAPGVQQGQEQVQPELLLVDGASLHALVRRLCPALEELLALTPHSEGACPEIDGLMLCAHNILAVYQGV